MAAGDPQSKKWQLTINNPQDCGLDHERLKEILSLFHPALTVDGCWIS